MKNVWKFMPLSKSIFFFVFLVPLAACGCEHTAIGRPAGVGTFFCRTGYALLHSPMNKTPLWVQEYLTAEHTEGPVPRSNNFQPDPDLPLGQRAELEDYKGSGYDRGHMAPAGDMQWSEKAMEESFYLSNMVPQVGPNMNQGIWATLEDTVRRWAKERGALYVITGPIGVSGIVGPNHVAVPASLYKIVYDPKTQEAIAFIMPNKAIPSRSLSPWIRSVDEVEEATGLDFLSALPAETQNQVESKRAPALW